MMPEIESIRNFEDKLVKLTNRTGYQLIQHNGQRIYSLPGTVVTPPKGCEVFIGKIPRDVLEDELVPIFEKMGEIYQFRLMMDFSGMNRGYGFVTYFQPEIANLAVTLLHGYAVRPNKKIGVYKSLDNCRLFVGGIPSNIKKEEVFEALSQYVEGIKDIIMYRSHSNKDLNRGFVFVEFYEHRLAAMARRKLAPGSLLLWGVPILVDWADPLPDVDNTLMSKVKKLYLRNLNAELGNEELMHEILKYVSYDNILKIHKILDYAFVHFTTRSAAETAMELLKGFRINDEPVEVMWARPKIYSKSYRVVNPPQHFCVSLPPRVKKQMQMNREVNANSTDKSSSSRQSLHSSNLSSPPVEYQNIQEYVNQNIGLSSQVLYPFFQNQATRMDMYQNSMSRIRFPSPHPDQIYCRTFNAASSNKDMMYNLNLQ